MQFLNAHSSNSKPHFECGFKCHKSENSLIIDFEIKAKESEFFYSEKFAKDSLENWGLWDYDVIEVFLSSSKSAPYLEIQLSPLNQKFALIIDEPRAKHHYPEWKDFKASSQLDRNVWRGQLEIELNKIPNFDGFIFANVFTILGEAREYYALNPNPEIAPDHHRPELFKELAC